MLGKRDADIPWTGGWMGSIAGLDVVAKREILAPARYQSPAIKPVVTHFSD
jgi:hypothetical protein